VDRLRHLNFESVDEGITVQATAFGLVTVVKPLRGELTTYKLLILKLQS
jgi:hypothetical protein